MTPQRRPNLALLRLFIDTNVIDADGASAQLRELARAGWIYLRKADVVDTELLGAADDVQAALLAASRAYPEELGPLFLGHSRVDSAVLGTADDETRLRDVFAILFPNVVFNEARKNHIRDAMHVATAIRACANGFVTRDKRVQAKSLVVATRFNGFTIYSPEAALQRAMNLITKRRQLHKLEPERGPLPAWPPEL